MTVSALDSNDDWTFGRGRANYKKRSNEVRQNVKTRIKCFVNDWFLDIRDGIPWYDLLGKRGTQDEILREVERRVLTTFGVRTIERLEVGGNANRVLNIILKFTTIYDDTVDENIKVEI